MDFTRDTRLLARAKGIPELLSRKGGGERNMTARRCVSNALSAASRDLANATDAAQSGSESTSGSLMERAKLSVSCKSGSRT